MYTARPAKIDRRPNGIKVVVYWEKDASSKIESSQFSDATKEGDWELMRCVSEVTVKGIVMATAEYNGVPSYIDDHTRRRIERRTVGEAENALIERAKDYADALSIISNEYGILFHQVASGG